MGQILGIGVTHYPGLIQPDQQMAGLLNRTLNSDQVPEEMKNPARWPAAMRSEWADPIKSAGEHRARLVNGFRKAREAIDAFDPDFVVIFGDDQYENFREDGVPSFCVFLQDEIESHPFSRYNAGSTNVWGEGKETVFRTSGHHAGGSYLAANLIKQDYDVSYAYRMRYENGLPHAFINTVLYLDYDRKGFDYPIIPFAINCYGRRVLAQRGGLPVFDRVIAEADLDPPAPTPKRLFDLGAATARVLAQSPYRVALLASSGWSHAFLTAKNHYLYPDTPSDRRMYDALRGCDWETWRGYSGAQVEDSGQQEILNWMCLAGAMSELKRKPKETGFVDTWIFNSSKAFSASARSR